MAHDGNLQQGTCVATLVAPGALQKTLSWEAGFFLVDDEVVPSVRVAAWVDSGYIHWASPEIESWYVDHYGPRSSRVVPRTMSAARPTTPRQRLSPCRIVTRTLAGLIATCAVVAGAGFALLIFALSPLALPPSGEGAIQHISYGFVMGLGIAGIGGGIAYGLFRFGEWWCDR